MYRIDDKKNPFIINKEDYIDRYVKLASKDYKIGYINISKKKKEDDVEYLVPKEWKEFLGNTSSYADDVFMIADHYKVKDRLIEIIIEYLSDTGLADKEKVGQMVSSINMQNLMHKIGTEFEELYNEGKLIMGSINGKYQLLEISEQLFRKMVPLVSITQRWGAPANKALVLTNVKTGTNQQLSLLEILKILRKYQPNIIHRFKGLGENDPDDVKFTIMDPNTRTLIKTLIGDIENDMKVFHTLRGFTPQDVLNRKKLVREFEVHPDMIDT